MKVSQVDLLDQVLDADVQIKEDRKGQRVDLHHDQNLDTRDE